MTRFEQYVIYGLASIVAEQNGYAVEEVLLKWKDDVERLWPATAKGKQGADSDVEEIYQAYPSRDPNNGNRPTGKGQKDKATIKRLLTNGEYTKDQLLTIIRLEVKSREETGAYLRNFSTFLNNLPDFEDEELFQ